MKDEDQFLSLVSKVLSNQATKEENEKLHNWIKQSNEREESFRMFSDIWQKTRLKRDSNKVESAFSKLNDRILLREESKVTRIKNNTILHNFRERYLSPIMKSAAVLLIVVASISVFYYAGNHKMEIKTEWITKYNPAGQKSKILLQDGTIVWLNSVSTLTYEKNFNDSARLVELEGEAYFEVAKDNFRPFKVFSKGLTTTVLGTAFNIRSFPSDSIISVCLVEGKVHLDLPSNTPGEKDFTLLPGDKLIYSCKSSQTRFTDIKPGLDLGWKDGLLVFHEANFKEVIDRLSVWYGVQFKVLNNSPKNWSYSGEFKNSTLEHILEVMSYIEEFDFQLKKDSVLIKFKNNHEN